jgi:hypothetical protein
MTQLINKVFENLKNLNEFYFSRPFTYPNGEHIEGCIYGSSHDGKYFLHITLERREVLQENEERGEKDNGIK